jgi:acetate kinase
MILVLNAGSSSLKAVLFGDDCVRLFQGSVTEIGGREGAASDHVAALASLVTKILAAGYGMAHIATIAHRVVHGGPGLTASQCLTPNVLREIADCAALAPLHNPPAVAVIRAMQSAAPDLPQTVHFDTAFHAANPTVATTYALPQTERDHGLRRFGFHGLSYASLVAQLPEPRPHRLLALHLGNGASLCAIKDGQSVATTMGYSPLDGLTMGTRAGMVDGNAVLDLARRHGIDGAARILNRESGLLGLGGHSDMRALHAAGTPEAAFAVDHFCYWAVRQAGSMIAAMGGVDAVAFTGGIGENDAQVRGQILRGLEWAGVTCDAEANKANAWHLHKNGAAVAVWIVPAAEEAHIAWEAMALMAADKAKA